MKARLFLGLKRRAQLVHSSIGPGLESLRCQIQGSLDIRTNTKAIPELVSTVQMPHKVLYVIKDHSM